MSVFREIRGAPVTARAAPAASPGAPARRPDALTGPKSPPGRRGWLAVALFALLLPLAPATLPGLPGHTAPSPAGPRAMPPPATAAPASVAAVPAPAPDRSREEGFPFIRNYLPRETGGGPENMAIVQDKRGVLYVANQEGILEYDGVSWRLIRIAGKSWVESLATDWSGKVYAGGIGEIGYLSPDELGQMRYVSMNERIPKKYRPFSHVLSIHIMAEGVLFHSLEYLYYFSRDRFKAWKADSGFIRSFLIGNKVYVWQHGSGLLVADGDSLCKVPGGEFFSDREIRVMLPMDGSAKTRGEPAARGMILIAAKDKFFLYNGEKAAPFAGEADRILEGNALKLGTVLANGEFALALKGGGFIVLDSDGRVRKSIDRSSGLKDDIIHGFFQDSAGGIWLAMSNGLSRLEMPSPLSIFDERSGLRGSIWSIARHQGDLYIGTNTGVFRMNSGATAGTRDLATGSEPVFKPIPPIKSYGWEFLSTEGSLLVSSSDGIYQILEDKAELISAHSYACSILRSRLDPSRIFICKGTGGVDSIYRKQGRWSSEGEIPNTKSISAENLLETRTGQLWLGTIDMGVYRVTFPPGRAGRGQGKEPLLEHFGTEHGLPTANRTFIHNIGDTLIAATCEGIFRFDAGTGRFSPDPRFTGLFPEGNRLIYELILDRQGQIWMHTRNERLGIEEVGMAIPLPDGRYRWENYPFSRFSGASIEAIFPEADGNVWFGSADSLYRYNPQKDKKTIFGFPALVRRVKTAGDRLLFGGVWVSGHQDEDRVPILDYADNALRFEYSALWYNREEANRFQVFLEGMDSRWSTWSSQTLKEYNNLPEGDYCFHVRARNIFKNMGREDVFRFRILPPWYRTRWAYAGYVILAGFMLFVLVHINTRRLKKAKIRLEKIVEERTATLQARTQELAHANTRLRELDQTKSDFLNMAAHDIRTPITSIVGFARLIQKKLGDILQPETEETRRIRSTRQVTENIGIIISEGDRLTALINDLLDLSKLESGKIELKTGLIQVSELFEQAQKATASLFEKKMLKVRQDLEDGLPDVVADRDRVLQVIINLLSNAVKFTPQGGSITCRAQRGIGPDTGYIQLSVADTGPGIPPEHLDRVFEKFQQFEEKNDLMKGTGLGLPICKTIVDLHGGRIWARSDPGQGSVFSFTLSVNP